jgi:hypothetical protein
MRFNSITILFTLLASSCAPIPLPGLTEFIPQAIKSCFGGKCSANVAHADESLLKVVEPFTHSYEKVQEGLKLADGNLHILNMELMDAALSRSEIRQIHEEIQELQSIKYLLNSHRKTHEWFSANERLMQD